MTLLRLLGDLLVYFGVTLLGTRPRGPEVPIGTRLRGLDVPFTLFLGFAGLSVVEILGFAGLSVVEPLVERPRGVPGEMWCNISFKLQKTCKILV